MMLVKELESEIEIEETKEELIIRRKESKLEVVMLRQKTNNNVSLFMGNKVFKTTNIIICEKNKEQILEKNKLEENTEISFTEEEINFVFNNLYLFL